MSRVTTVLALVAAATLASSYSAAATIPRPFDSRVVWSTAPADVYCEDGRCLKPLMYASGAAPQAVNFALSMTESHKMPTWAVKFEDLGPVGLVTYDCTGGSCRVGGWAVVSGQPRVVDYLSAYPVLENALNQYKQDWPSHPNALVTRYPLYMGHGATKEGEVDVYFSASISDCQACDPLEGILYSLSFESTGRYLGAKFLKFIPVRMTKKGISPPGH